jgi:hypothetical protein
MFAQKDFEIDDVLYKPLMAHLSTVKQGVPRDSPVWFLWEDSCLWIFGISGDSFVKRLLTEPQCAAGKLLLIALGTTFHYFLLRNCWNLP